LRIADCGLRIYLGIVDCGIADLLIESAINPQSAILNPQYTFHFPGGCGVGV